jgi:hypothetical protein
VIFEPEGQVNLKSLSLQLSRIKQTKWWKLSWTSRKLQFKLCSAPGRPNMVFSASSVG